MKAIANLTATLLHRHYGEHAFAEALALDQLHGLQIITYGSASNLAAMVKHLQNTFLCRAKGSCRVLIGLSNIDGMDADALTAQIDQAFKHFDPASGISLFLHGACHIKLLSYRGVSFLGSQNLSGAAEPYFNGIGGKAYFNRFHEALIRVEDPDNYCATTLFDEVLNDRVQCQQIEQRRDARVYAQALLEGVKIDTAASHVALAMQLRELLHGVERYIDVQAGSIERVDLFKQLSAIARASAPRKLVETLLNELYGSDNFADFKDQALLFKLWRLVDPLSDQLSRHKSQVLQLIEEAEALEQLLFAEETLDALAEDLQRLAEDRRLADLEEFVDDQQWAIIQAIQEDPRYEQSYLYGAVDEDGNLDSERLRRNAGNAALMSIEQKLEHIDPRPVLSAIEACLNRYLSGLHDSSELIMQANNLLQDIERQYQHELHSEEFRLFLRRRNLLPDTPAF